MKSLRVVFVAGGTGGHVFPALSFGDWIRRKHPGTELFYVCGDRPLERDIYAHCGIEPDVLPLEGSPRGVCGWDSAKRWKNLVLAFFRSLQLLRRLRPDAVCLFGSYISLPVMMAAKMLGIRQVIHEQNARAGQVTVLAQRWGLPVASGWPRCEPFKDGTTFFTGVPIRSVNRLHRDEAWHKLVSGRLCPQRRMLLVLSGSLGSSDLESFAEHVVSSGSFRDWLLVEIGTVSEPTWRRETFLRLPRTWNMAPLFSLADFALCRGGASTLWELLLWGIPALVVPWRQACDDHQLANACSFQALGGGSLWLEGVHRSEDIPDLLEAVRMKPDQGPDQGRSIPGFTGDDICQSLWRVLTDTH